MADAENGLQLQHEILTEDVLANINNYRKDVIYSLQQNKETKPGAEIFYGDCTIKLLSSKKLNTCTYITVADCVIFQKKQQLGLIGFCTFSVDKHPSMKWIQQV